MKMTGILLAATICAAGASAQETSEATDSIADSYFDLTEVVVTGVRAPRLLKDTPVQTRLITAKEIMRSDATNVEDLLQQEMPGVEFSYAMNQQVHLNFNGQGARACCSWWMANVLPERQWTMWTSRGSTSRMSTI